MKLPNQVNTELGSENLDDSREQALRSKLEQLVTKLNSSHAANIKNSEVKVCYGFVGNFKQQ